MARVNAGRQRRADGSPNPNLNLKSFASGPSLQRTAALLVHPLASKWNMRRAFTRKTNPSATGPTNLPDLLPESEVPRQTQNLGRERA